MNGWIDRQRRFLFLFLVCVCVLRERCMNGSEFGANMDK